MSETGGWFVVGRCIVCGDVFSFNPYKVPSIPVDADGLPARNGRREPLCQACAEPINVERAARGLATWSLEGAYEPEPGLP
jgi:hypothetical protein